MPRSKTVRFQFTGPDGGAKMFRDKITELLERAKRLQTLEAKGYRYEKVWIKATTVKAHRRRGYHAMMPRKRK